MARRIDPELKRVAETLRAQYGDHLRQILFFGSRARGDASAESDYDCLLVLDQVTHSVKVGLDQLAARLLMEQGMVLAWIAVSEAELERLRYEPFLQNARREGIAA